jgi:hypothetical protein
MRILSFAGLIALVAWLGPSFCSSGQSVTGRPRWLLSISGTAGWQYSFAYKDNPAEEAKPLFVYIASTNGPVRYIDHTSSTGLRYYEARTDRLWDSGTPFIQPAFTGTQRLVLTISGPTNFSCTVEKSETADFQTHRFWLSYTITNSLPAHFVDDEFTDRLPWFEPSTNHQRFYRVTIQGQTESQAPK